MILAIEFGSHRRGDYDLTSDKDLLLVGSDWNKIAFEADAWSKRGFSISAFSFDKARYLVRNGNLFFKHICDEGVLVTGAEARFRELIAGWQVANNYFEEISENLDLLEVISFIPQSTMGVAAAIDILISSVRNILIRRLACDGEYVFAWAKVFAEARRRQMIKASDVPLLMSARSLKNAYRQGSVHSPSLSYLEALFEASNRACGIVLKPNFARRIDIRSLPEKCEDGTYKQLRAVELMCAEYLFDDGMGSLLALVRRPAYFCANGPSRSIQAMPASASAAA